MCQWKQEGPILLTFVRIVPSMNACNGKNTSDQVIDLLQRSSFHLSQGVNGSLAVGRLHYKWLKDGV